MATVQVDGSAVTTTSTRNNRGVIRRGGNVGGTLFVAKSLGDTLIRLNAPVEGQGVEKALSAGTFLSTVKSIVRRVTATLAGVSNTALVSGGSDHGQRRAIHSIESLKVSFLHSWSWTSDSEGNLTYSATVNTTNANFGNDHAARPTYAIPGELTYKGPAPNPVNADYSAKTS